MLNHNRFMGSIIVVCILYLFAAEQIWAATVNLSWDYDAAAEADIQGYRLYYDTISHTDATDPDDLVSPLPYATRIEIPDPTKRAYSLQLSPGTYYFRMTSYGLVNGNPVDSVFSEEASGQVGIATITNITITITYP